MGIRWRRTKVTPRFLLRVAVPAPQRRSGFVGDAENFSCRHVESEREISYPGHALPLRDQLSPWITFSLSGKLHLLPFLVTSHLTCTSPCFDFLVSIDLYSLRNTPQTSHVLTPQTSSVPRAHHLLATCFPLQHSLCTSVGAPPCRCPSPPL